MEFNEQASACDRSQTRKEADRVWRILWQRQVQGIRSKMCLPFLRGLELADMDGSRFPRHAQLSRRLHDQCGWRIESVPGLIPVREFFALLREQRFPAPEWIRGMSHLEYTPEPDAFHDLFGHIPQLLSSEFRTLLNELARRAQHANAASLLEIERVYWFSIEFGLTMQAGALRAMGAGLASSSSELERALQARNVRRIDFDLRQARARPFVTDRAQSCYLIAPSLDQLGERIQSQAGWR